MLQLTINVRNNLYHNSPHEGDCLQAATLHSKLRPNRCR